jgi:hypothetical protein
MTEGEVRRAWLWAITVFLAGAAQAVAGQSHPHAGSLPSKPAAVVQPDSGVDSGIVDATTLGSPILLDKGWRVGVSSDAGAANPGFDD